METQQTQKSFYILLFALLGIICLSFFSSFTRFVVAKDYNFHVEIPCESTGTNCYIRDCDDYCPPNGLESYRVFIMPAQLYGECDNNSCKNICLNNKDTCEEIKCSFENGDDCSVTE